MLGEEQKDGGATITDRLAASAHLRTGFTHLAGINTATPIRLKMSPHSSMTLGAMMDTGTIYPVTQVHKHSHSVSRLMFCMQTSLGNFVLFF